MEKEWLKTFREGIDNIGDLVDTLHYHHGVEVLTMLFCLFGDAAVLEYRSDFIDQHTITLQHDLNNHVKDHGVVPHPAVLLKNHFPLAQKQPAASIATMRKRLASAMSSVMFMVSESE